MNKYIVTIALLCMSLSSMAEDIIQVVPFSTKAGATSDDMMTFNIEMTNTEDVWGLQFDLYLPDGMRLDYTDDYPPYDDISDGDYGTRYPYTSGRGGSKTYKHGVDWNDLKNGHYWFAVTPNDESFITGTSGTILTMYYTTSADMKPGIYPIIIRKTVMSELTFDERPVDAISYVKVGNPGNDMVDLGDYYVPSFVQTELAKEKNIIAGGKCQNLVLSDANDFVVENSFTAVSASYNANVSASLGYKTLVLPYNCAVPAGFKAWEVASVVGNTLNMQEVSSITADKPVILEGNGTAAMNAANVSITVSGAELENAELVGTYQEIDAPVGSYVLQNHDGNVAFYEVVDVQPKVGAFRAYLKNQVSGSKKMIINFGTATAIMDVESGLVEKAEAVYGIDGTVQNGIKRGYNVLRMKDGSVRKLFNK